MPEIKDKDSVRGAIFYRVNCPEALSIFRLLPITPPITIPATLREQPAYYTLLIGLELLFVCRRGVGRRFVIDLYAFWAAPYFEN